MRTFDLNVSGRAVDVKSARRSFASRNSYSEYCVARFKKDRNERHVAITGVLMDYVPAWDMSDGDVPLATILGEVDHDILTRAAAFGAELTSGALTITGFARPSHLPGWVFVLPEWCYPEGRIDVLADALRRFINDGIDRSTFSWPLRRLVIENGDDVPDASVSRLERMIAALGPNRLAACLFALVEFVLAIRGDAAADPARTCGLLIPAEKHDIVLYACDVEGFARSFIRALSTIWQRADRSELLAFRSFHLAGGGILQGVEPGGVRKTLLAYCGGWDSVRNVKCGKSPLVLGEHHWCVECWHLICSECSHCTDGCPANAPRRQAEAADRMVRSESA
jgi:hypothetical protein